MKNLTLAATALSLTAKAPLSLILMLMQLKKGKRGRLFRLPIFSCEGQLR
jgi:hypothetical protein